MMNKSMLLLVAIVFFQARLTKAQTAFYGYSVGYGSFATLPASFTSIPSGTTEEIPSERILMPIIGIALDKPLVKIGRDAGIGIHTNPNLSFPTSNKSMSVVNGGRYTVSRPIIHAPLMVTVGYGAFSHASSESERGFALGLGLHAQYLFEPLSGSRSTVPDASGKTFITAPAAKASFRFWLPNDQLMSVSILHAFASESFAAQTVNRSATMLNLAVHLNY